MILFVEKDRQFQQGLTQKDLHVLVFRINDHPVSTGFVLITTGLVGSFSQQSNQSNLGGNFSRMSVLFTPKPLGK